MLVVSPWVQQLPKGFKPVYVVDARGEPAPKRVMKRATRLRYNNRGGVQVIRVR